MTDHDQILIALRRITRAIDLQSRQLVKQTGLTAPQLVVMMALDKDGPLCPTDIAKQIAASPATVTTIVDRLEALGLVQRREKPTDRRVTHILLTPKGEAAYRAAPELLQAGFLARFRSLECWEQHMLLSSLERIAALMDAEAISASPILTSEEWATDEDPIG